MASHRKRPAPKRKLAKVPEPWEKLHKQGVTRRLQAEAKSTVKMRTEVRRIHSQLVSMLDGTKAQGLRSLKAARQHMANAVSEQIQKTRVLAKDAALNQAQAELKQLTKSVRAKGKRVRDLHHRLGSSAGELKASATASDLATADAVGNAFASRWAQSVLHHIINAKDADDTDLAYNARLAAAQMDHQIRRIAATETGKAYNEEHDEAVEDALSDDDLDDLGIEAPGEPGEWAGEGAYKMWNAMADKAVCVDCAAHDGEIVPVGEDFSSGDIPGAVHPNCRCIQTMVHV